MTADVDCGGLRRADSGCERSGIQCSEHGSGILIDHRQQCASWRFWGPAASFPVLDRVRLKPNVSENLACVMKNKCLLRVQGVDLTYLL